MSTTARRRLPRMLYGFISGAWPFGVVEAIWCVIAMRRYRAVTAR